jgi:hypothetical protein
MCSILNNNNNDDEDGDGDGDDDNDNDADNDNNGGVTDRYICPLNLRVIVFLQNLHWA